MSLWNLVQYSLTVPVCVMALILLLAASLVSASPKAVLMPSTKASHVAYVTCSRMGTTHWAAFPRSLFAAYINFCLSVIFVLSENLLLHCRIHVFRVYASP